MADRLSRFGWFKRDVKVRPKKESKVADLEKKVREKKPRKRT